MASVQDSAGVRIVSDPTALADLPEALSVSGQPVFVIGAEEERADEVLTRTGPLAFGEGGTLAVVDEGTDEIRLFDLDGSLVRVVGGSGRGPGEFGSIGAIALDGRLRVWDPSLDRVTEFEPTGEVLETYPIPLPSGGWPARVLFLESGEMVFGQNILDQEPSIEGVSLRHDSLLLMTVRDRGARIDTLGKLRGAESINEMRIFGEARIVDMPRVPFGADVFIRSLGDRLLIGRSEDFELRVHSPDGRLEQIWRYPAFSFRVTESDRTRFRNSPGVNGLVPGEDQVDTWFDAFPPDELPAFTDIVVGRDTPIWVKDPRAQEQGTWWLVSQSAELLGRATLPTGFDLRAVSVDRVAGVHKDQFDAERVEVYRLQH